MIAAPRPLPFSLDDVFSARVSVLRHVPKTARRDLAALKNTVWNSVLRDPHNLDNWTKAFAYTKLVLFFPPGKNNFKEKAAVVKDRIRAFLDGRFEELWLQATRRPRGARTSAPQAAGNVRRAILFAQEGQHGKAAKALISNGLDFNSEEAIENMRIQHPHSPPPPPLPPRPVSPYTFSSADVLAALNSFHSLSAGGPSGARPSHFRECLASDRGNALLSTMTRLINFLAAGKAPTIVAPFLCGGNLFAALKKTGGHRPIAVGDTLRRWTAKSVARKGTADTAEFLAPLQVGVGVKGGAEAVIHAANAAFIDDGISADDKWTLRTPPSSARRAQYKKKKK